MWRILIVEDDPDILEMLSSWLGDAGYAATEAEDGMEALEKFAGETFDLVLLDLMLPKIDGFGVAEWIRRRSDVPILMLTALDGEEEQLRGYDLKIDDYVTKPFSMPVLLRKIGAILRRAQGSPQEMRMLHYRDLMLNLDAYTARRGTGGAGPDEPGIRMPAGAAAKPGPGRNVPDADRPHLELRLPGRRPGGLQPYQKPAAKAGGRLHHHRQGGRLSCGKKLRPA